MQSLQLDHLNLSVNRFADSAAWYGRVFGFEVVEEGVWKGAPWGVLRKDDSMLCLYEYPEKQQIRDDEQAERRFHHLSHFALRIHDVAAWEQVLQREQLPLEYGGEPIRWPHSTSWYVRDPSGHEIEVVYWDEDRIRFG